MATVKISALTAANTIDGSADYFPIVTSSLSATQKINRNTFLGVSGTPADISSSQTFTNKVLGNTNTITVKDTLFTIQDDGDATKQAQFQLSGITTGNTRTLTVPDASLTIVGTATTQTLTNKTLTSPTITGGTIDNTTITVDSISGHSTSTIVTVGGVQMNNGTIGTSGAVVSASIAAGAVVPNSLQASAGTGWAWQNWLPTWANFTPGNATTSYTYTQIGKTVFFQITVTLGSTSVMGTSPTFTLPVTANSVYTTSSILGRAYMFVAASYLGIAFFTSTTVGNFYVEQTSGTYNVPTGITASVPAAWASTHTFFITGSYQAA